MSQEKENEELIKTYKKHKHEEHILKIPDTYIGSVEYNEDEIWLLNDDKKMEKTKLLYIPGLYKIFDEIVVNALDQWQRLKTKKEVFAKNSKIHINEVKNIKIDYDIDNNEISVYNDGDGIDIALHPEHNLYIPEMIFGQLLTSTNYDENEKKITGGKNGYGAKLTNIFSTTFTIETVDSVRKKHFIQTYRNNMKIKETPIIKDYKDTPYTRITFKPDLERFKIQKLDHDFIKLIEKRAYDLNGCTDKKLDVYLNGNKINFKDFEGYVDCYIGNKNETIRAYEKVNDRWEISATMSSDNVFEQVSFVNGVNTSKGGKHVEHVTSIIVKKLTEYISKKRKINISKPAYIRDNLMLFCKSIIENPSFDSQLKENLTTNVSQFGSKCEPISDKFIEKLASTGIVEKCITYYEFKESKKLKANDGKKSSSLRGIEKLDDANWAGTDKSSECTLILTEGDSAKSMAIAGLSVVGRDKYGVFPLRGKLLNVRDRMNTLKGKQQISDNTEITNLKKIIGLRMCDDICDISELRYGRIMIMTDQDVDGSHIKGLICNLFDCVWSNLIKHDGFLTCMITPIVKVTKGDEVISFYNLTDYENWRTENNECKGWKIKYYKGLGTSSSSEAKEYFRNLKMQKLCWNDESKDSLELAFNKDRSDDRKKWLANFDTQNVLNPDTEIVYFNDFINKEFIHFSNYDLERSIPNICDGLKTSQRKILYSCFKRNLKNEIRVAQLSGYVSENASYHHGEMSLQGAIIGMAQDYVCSNNINILEPIGQFGTRLQGGKDSASPRYIHTCLEKITNYLYPDKDMPVLKHLYDDGMQVEPEYYVPIIPMILVNGTKGIGTGYSSDVPMFNPLDIVKCIKSLLNQEELPSIHPWYYGSKQDIIKIKEQQYLTKGKYKILNYKTVEITDLPIGTWTEDYKEFLETLLVDYVDKKKNDNKCKTNKGYIKNFENHSSESQIKFILEFRPDILKKLNFSKENEHMNKLEKELRLTSTISTSNMCLFNHKNVIHKYQNVEEIINEFYQVRYQKYKERKQYQLDKMKFDAEILSQKTKFILGIVNDTIIINKKSKAEIYQQLEEQEFKKMNNNGAFDTEHGNYNYLINMSISNLTLERKNDLENDYQAKIGEIQELTNMTEKDIWLFELEEFEKIYKTYLEKKDSKYEDDTILNKLKKKDKKTSATKQPAKKKKIIVKK